MILEVLVSAILLQYLVVKARLLRPPGVSQACPLTHMEQTSQFGPILEEPWQQLPMLYHSEVSKVRSCYNFLGTKLGPKHLPNRWLMQAIVMLDVGDELSVDELVFQKLRPCGGLLFSGPS